MGIRKYIRPARKSPAAIGVISVTFSENGGSVSGQVKVHYETADGEDYGQPDLRSFDELPLGQRTIIERLFSRIRGRASNQTSLLERNPTEEES